MDDEQEDVKKMTDFINKQKSTCQTSFQVEFQNFINFKENYDCSDQEESEDDETQLFQDHNSIKSFNEEEQNVIDSCLDPELKQLLILNRSKNMQLIKLHKKIQELLLQCEEEIEERRFSMKNSETKQTTQHTFVWKLAAPYFKDKKFFPCPLNQDAFLKRSRNELSVYERAPSPKWTPIEFDHLINAVKCNYNINRQNSLRDKINILKAKMRNEDTEDKTNLKEMIKLKQQLEELKKDDKVPPLNSNECINWYKVSEIFLKDKHTPLECQSVWHMLIHPAINKSEWTDEESKNVELLAKQYSYQKWDEIAQELKTGRTGFTTCLHYFSKLCDKFKKNKFTPEEDAHLLEVLDIYKIGDFIPWNKVVCHFTDRSRHQLYHRYTYFLSQNHVKRGKFSEAEDILLIILVNKFGRNFKKCTEYMPYRSQIQLKSRYNSNLQRHIKKGTFTSEDDQIIYEYAQKHGEKNWSALTGRLNRCNAQIRQRYKLIKTFLKDNPCLSVIDIPKRRHRFDEVNEGQHGFLNYMAEQYSQVDYIPTLSMIEESLQAELGPAPSNLPITFSETTEVKVKNIDALLTDFFSSSMKINKQCTIITETNLSEAADNVESVLRSLGSNLIIPKKLEYDINLDNIDLEILERLSKKNFETDEPKIDKIFAPNLSTLVALRGLIIKHKEYKVRQKASGQQSDSFLWPMEQNLLKLDASDRSEILSHRNLFCTRFAALLDWSAILSLEKPNTQQISPESGIVPVVVGTSTYKRSSNQDNSKIKRRKIDISALANLKQVKNAQLIPVDKHVIEELMRRNNIDIIRIESVTGNVADVQPNCSLNTQVSSPGSPRNSSLEDDDAAEDMADDEDVEDVERLNAMLNSVKSENTDDSSGGSGEEYQVIKDDVQLLKEILKYEKEKVKPDPDLF